MALSTAPGLWRHPCDGEQRVVACALCDPTRKLGTGWDCLKLKMVHAVVRHLKVDDRPTVAIVGSPT